MFNQCSLFVKRNAFNIISRTRTYIKVRGVNVLRSPEFNKDTAFTIKERHLLGIHGLLPPAVDTLSEQSVRTMISLKKSGDDLHKHLFLTSLMERNEVLFYKVITDNIEYCMPLIYTPTVGLACQKYGLMFRRSRGLYITIHDKMHIKQILNNWPSDIIKAIVVTDGERILGLGDLGAYGMGIPIGKLSLYTALAGVPPRYALPVVLDVGTNNQELLDDPMYLGLRHERIRGAAYDEFLDAFMVKATEKYGRNTLIQFEDFGNLNAYRILNKYRDKYCTFNDDIQGTASVCLGAFLGAEKISKRKLQDNKFLFQGAGSAATGIAELITKALINRGDTEEEATSKIFMFDINGLLTKSRKKSSFTQENIKYAKDLPETKSLEHAVNLIKPTSIIGVAGVGKVFTAAILRKMKENVDFPYIFALSNPTSKAECSAEEAYQHTEGKCVFASGSPFDPVEINQKIYYPTQCNNSYIFPGIALAIILFKIRPITIEIFVIAAETLASLVSEEEVDSGRIFPSLYSIRDVSISIAIAVAEYAYEVQLSYRIPEPPNKEEFIKRYMFSPKYKKSLPDLYHYPK